MDDRKSEKEDGETNGDDETVNIQNFFILLIGIEDGWREETIGNGGWEERKWEMTVLFF